MRIDCFRHFLCVAWLLALFVSPTAQAQSSQCGFIQNPDEQAYCRAINGGGSGQCGFIRDNDLQARCAQKQVVARVSAALSETQTSRQPVARVRKKEAAHRAGLPVNVDLFKTRTDRPIAAPRLEVVLDNAVLFEITTCKPCVAPRLAALRSQCGFIRDPDMKAACRAKTR